MLLLCTLVGAGTLGIILVLVGVALHEAAERDDPRMGASRFLDPSRESAGETKPPRRVETGR